MRTTIARILVPTDFSATADAALEYARALAVRLGASLRIVHVIEEAYFGGTVGGEVYLPERRTCATRCDRRPSSCSARTRRGD
jgi:nucleotide-binding universal stress UspA family protein